MGVHISMHSNKVSLQERHSSLVVHTRPLAEGLARRPVHVSRKSRMQSFFGAQQDHSSRAACKAPHGPTKVFSKQLQSGVGQRDGELGRALLAAAALQEGLDAGQPVGSKVCYDDVLDLLQRDEALQAGHCRAKTRENLVGSRDWLTTQISRWLYC